MEIIYIAKDNTQTLFPSGVKRILVTEPAIPGSLCVATDRGVPNSHMVTEPSKEPVKSTAERRRRSKNGQEEVTAELRVRNDSQ